MRCGYTLDALRYSLSRPSSAVMASWPVGTYLLETDAGKVRVQDTGSNKPVLLMAPDGPCVIEHYSILISKLSSHFRVICFDMPGVGFSYPKLGYDFGLADSSKVIIAVMDALNVSRAALSFSCVNSYFALAVAKNNPERVSRLVLAQAPSIGDMRTQWVARNIPKPLRIPLLGQAVNALTEKKLSSIWYGVALPKESSCKQPFVNESLAMLHSGGCFCLASIAQGVGGVADSDLCGVEVPSTMVWGNKDWSHKSTQFESFLDHVPHCEVIQFDGCGHFPNLEQPQSFAELLTAVI